ncbi:MAG: hypothetical protein ACOX0Y_03165 [Thiopseudomonas sp.]
MKQKLNDFVKRARRYFGSIPLETALRYSEAVVKLGFTMIAGSLAGLFLSHVSGFFITPTRCIFMLLVGCFITAHGFYVDSETTKKLKQE